MEISTKIVTDGFENKLDSCWNDFILKTVDIVYNECEWTEKKIGLI